MSRLSPPFRQVLEAIQVRHRVHAQQPRVVTVPARERELAWHRLTTQLSYLVPDEERLEEAKEWAQRISRAGAE